MSRNWAGEPLDSYQKILNYARTTKTQTGLSVTAYLDRHNDRRQLELPAVLPQLSMLPNS